MSCYEVAQPIRESNVDSNRIEAVITSVGFDDVLDETLDNNHPHLDTAIIVTSHYDIQTQKVARKHGAICVQTDLFHKNDRNFNKGAAINAGFNHFQYNGWRLHIDADIAFPDNFRRMLFNHMHLEKDCIYGADRVDIIGMEEWLKVKNHTQYKHGVFIHTPGKIGSRFVHNLYGYLPIGYLQLWHAKCQMSYPYSLGTAAHDDVMFSMQWPESQRRLLPGVVCYHLCASEPKLGENWDGNRKQERFK